MNISSKVKVIAIVGPTASGKTSYSIKLADEIGGEIISADSRLVYKGFDIATAKPTKDEMQGINHYMIDIVEPEFDYSAGLYKKQARELIYQIASRGKKPIVVGGTGLYTDILLCGYNLPQMDNNIKLRNELSNYSNNELYSMLKKYDYQSAENIDTNDRKKLIRALEVIKTTGKTLSNARGKTESEFEVEWIGCNYERPILYERINKRVDLMLEQGLIEETKALLNRHGRIYNLVNTIGYREVIKYIDGEMTLDESIELLKQNTRKYAKRQLTWFRRNNEIKWNIYPEKMRK